MKQTTLISTRPLGGRGSKWMTALALAAALPLTHADSLFEFNFDEGTGSIVKNTTETLTGSLGRVLDPSNYPESNPDSPSAAEGDASLKINGTEGYLVLDATGSTTELADFTRPLTVEAWINIPFTATARAEGIVGYGASWKLGLRPDGRVAFTMFGIVDATVEIYPVIGAWTHLAATWEPGVGITYFVDGVEAAFFEETRPMRVPQHNYIGIGSAGTAEPIDASIDRVRVHQAKLTADELDAVAAEPKPVLSSTIVAFDFNSTPYTSAGKIQKTAVNAQDLFIANSSPQFVTDTPSKQAGDTALSFYGDDRVVVPDDGQQMTLTTGDFTIQGWVKFDTTPGARSVIFSNNGPGGAVTFSVTSDRHLFVTTLGIADTRSEAIIPNDTLWHHIAVVHRNGQELRFYVDGVLGDTIPYTQGVLMTRTDTYFTIGAENAGGLPYRGLLDRLKVANEALPASELDYLAVPGVDPGTPELEIGTAVSISWPNSVTGFVLESTTSLTEPKVWTAVSVSPVSIGDKYYVLLPTAEQETFYRLVRPVEE